MQPVDYINEVGYKAYHEKPVGTGPYMVTEWKHKASIEMAKNPEYWDKANAGYVDTIHMPIITSSQTSWLQFQKGDVDYTHLPPGQFKAAQAMPQTTSGEWTVKGWTYIANDYIVFNMNDKVVGGDAGPRAAQGDVHGRRRAERRQHRPRGTGDGGHQLHPAGPARLGAPT